VQGKDFAVRCGRLFRSHHDLESKKTERNTENLSQREIRDTVAFVKACNQANGQEALVGGEEVEGGGFIGETSCE
jgi:hypothetical protein